MTGILTLRDAIVQVITDQMPELASVEKVKGKITEQGLQRLGMRNPSVGVACLGFQELRPIDTGIFNVKLIMIAFLTTEGRDRVDEGSTLLEQLSLLIATNTWGVPHTGLPTEIEGQVIYDDRVSASKETVNDFSENGMLLQAVSWLQTTRIQRVSPATGAGRADDRAQAEALGQKTELGDWPEMLETEIIHPRGVK